MIVIDPTRTFEFVPPSQAVLESPGTLIVRALTVRERHRIYPRMGNVQTLSDSVWEVLEHAVVGWKNFHDADGNELAYDVAYIDHLPDEYAMGAYEYVMELSRVSPEEAGK